MGIFVDIQWYRSKFSLRSLEKDGTLSEQELLKPDLRMEICLDDMDAFSFEDSRRIVGVIFLPMGHRYVNAQKNLTHRVCRCDIQGYIFNFSFAESQEEWDTKRTRAVETGFEAEDLFR